jgi:hypothetical protein
MPRRAAFLAVLVAAATTAVSASAGAAVRIGSNLLSTPASAGVCSGADCTVVNLALPASNRTPDGIVSSVNGTVTNWSYRSAGPSGPPISLRVVHPTGGLSFTGAGTTASAPVFGGIRGLFPANLPIEIGDLVGLEANGAQVMVDGVPGATQGSWTSPPLADGSNRPATTSPGVETMVQATIQPTNTVRFGAVQRHRRKGTATVDVAIPNAGTLAYGGPGVRVRGPASVAGHSQISIVVASKGKKLTRLKRRGNAHVQPQIVFTPVLGEPGTTVEKLKLLRKRRSAP